MEAAGFEQVLTDLTTKTYGTNEQAEPLVYMRPCVRQTVPGKLWTGALGQAKAAVRLPDAKLWNGKLLIGGIPAVRNEYSLDLILGDIALQRGYAFATCDKATPGLVLRDPDRTMAEWEQSYEMLTRFAVDLVTKEYGSAPARTYIAGVSNGGYVTRIMMERHPQLFDGAIEWEGVLWHTKTRHLLTTLPVYVKDFPIYCNWRGDRTSHEQQAALGRLVEAGLPEVTEPFWNTYFQTYWVLSLWLYGRSLDPAWRPFSQDWSNDWLKDPSAIADYPWQERQDILDERITPIANSGQLTKPMLSVAGNWDCLVSFEHNAKAYADLVAKADATAHHRLYEIPGGNHVDGMLHAGRGGQQPVQPYFEAAFYHLENWVECGTLPPVSGVFERVDQFASGVHELYSYVEVRN